MPRLLSTFTGVWLLALVGVASAETPRFSAMLSDGQRIDGQRLHDWHENGTVPRLDNQELMNAGNPLVWLCDRTLRPGDPPRAYLEMTTGDRLPGEIVSYETGDPATWASLPPHFIVRPTVNVSPPQGEPHPYVRVLARFVRRIVRQPHASAAAYQPGTLFTRHGRTVKFRAARFAGGDVRLLTDAGQQVIPLGDICQLHMPEVDPWEAYVDELAVVSPYGADRLLQFESTDGAVITGSTARLQIFTDGNEKNSDHWWHALHPAWSLEPLWLQNTRIWARRSWAFDQVPLTRARPTIAISKSLLHNGPRAWQVNANVEGRPLHAGRQPHGWGFGVHAYSELHFALPEYATGFRARVSLDDVVGTGGCVIARVFAGSVKSQPLYQSPHLVGSNSLQDTGVLSLAGGDVKQRTLILQVDAAAHDRPQNADPFDIRDMFDWLDPLVILDATKLREAIVPRIAPLNLPLADWQIVQHPAGVYTWSNVWEISQMPRLGKFQLGVRVENQPLKLVRDLKVEPQHQWLLVSIYRNIAASPEPEISVRIDGVEIVKAAVPLDFRPALPQPLLVPLGAYLGHTIHLEIVIPPPKQTTSRPVHVYGVQILDQAPMLYRVLEDDERFTPLKKNEKSTAALVESDKRMGRRCLELTLGGGHRISFAQPIEIRGGPGPLQKRFLRFALRKLGRGAVTLELEHAEMQTRPAIYRAGVPLASAQDEAQPALKPLDVWNLELPDEWVVLTRDVFSDFGDLNVTGVILRTPDGERARLDHIYFARAGEDFQLLPQAPPPEIARPDARRELLRSIVERAQPATVGIEVEGRLATGFVFSGDEMVLTAGHVLGGPGRDAIVHLVDGRRLPAKTLGIYRSGNIGLVQIVDRRDLQLARLELNDQRDISEADLYVGLSLAPFVVETPGAEPEVIAVAKNLRETLWSSLVRENIAAGGPLVARDGRVVGTHVARSPWGGMLYTKGFVARENWERMKSGEIYGEWLAGTAPQLGIEFIEADGAVKITSLTPDTPAAASDLKPGDVLERLDGQPIASRADIDRLLSQRDPGAEVTLDLLRSGQALQQRVKLIPRSP